MWLFLLGMFLGGTLGYFAAALMTKAAVTDLIDQLAVLQGRYRRLLDDYAARFRTIYDRN